VNLWLGVCYRLKVDCLEVKKLYIVMDGWLYFE